MSEVSGDENHETHVTARQLNGRSARRVPTESFCSTVRNFPRDYLPFFSALHRAPAESECMQIYSRRDTVEEAVQDKFRREC